MMFALCKSNSIFNLIDRKSYEIVKLENIIHFKFIFQPNQSQPTPARPNRTPSSSGEPRQSPAESVPTQLGATYSTEMSPPERS